MLLLRLMRGAATGAELRTLIRQHAAPHDSLTEAQIEKRFEECRHRLKESFQCTLHYERGTDSYTLERIERALLDLSPEAVRGFAFLQSIFRSDSAPMSEDVQALLDRLLTLLPSERRREVEQAPSVLEIDLQVRDQDFIAPEVWEGVQRAIRQHRQLEFAYSAKKDGDRVKHIVEPLRCTFDPVRGHYYLHTLRVETISVNGAKRWADNVIYSYRLGRMSEVRVLPTHFVAGQRIKRFELRYVLSADLARKGVTQHFPDSTIIPHSDGSVEVVASSTDIFSDVRRLLHYGANCRVIGGDAAVDEMRKLVRGLAEVYLDDHDQTVK
jgi:predicted DNA-binding transcriptional regulator YafY